MPPSNTLSRQPNLTYRSWEYLAPKEVQRLLETAGQRGRHLLRDRTLLLLMFRHGLRAGEACLLWDAVILEECCIAITRLNVSHSGVHRLQPDELEALVLLRERCAGSYALFVNERGTRLTTGALSKIMKRSGELADLRLPVHPRRC